MRLPLLSYVVTAHGEGAYARSAIRSIAAAAADVRDDLEIVVVADDPDPATRSALRSRDVETRMIEVKTGDPSLSRNLGAEAARGEWLTFLDADDVTSAAWLRGIVGVARERRPNAVVHPEWTVIFGEELSLQRHFSSSEVDLRLLISTNAWTSVLAGPRSLFLSQPFRRFEPGLGYEDWHWVLELLSRGGEVRVLPDTTSFVRRKLAGSLLNESRAGRRLLMPTTLFGDHVQPPTLAPGPNLVDRSTMRAVQAAASWHPRLVHQLRSLFHATRAVRANLLPTWIPAAIRSELPSVRRVEPAIPTAARLAQGGIRFAAKPARWATDWVRARAQLGASRYLFLLRSLGKGGAELEALNYIRAVAERCPAGRVAVVTTDASDHPWRSKLPPGTTHVDVASTIAQLSADDGARFLATLIVQAEPAWIHVVNSRAALHALHRHGEGIASTAKVFLSLFCYEYSRDGAPGGYAASHLPSIIGHLSTVFTDSRWFADVLIEATGAPPETFQTHYQPTEVAPAVPGARDGGRLRVLWAARATRQKRIDLLLDVARAARGNVEADFYVYTDAASMVRSRPGAPHENVHYCGGFDGFTSLPLSDFDVFVSTAEWDGLANALIEAMAAGLVVVAAGSGGAEELVRDGDTGCLIRPFDDVAQYVEALRRLQADPSLRARLREHGLRLVETRHRWPAFIEQLARVPAYLPVEGAERQSAELRERR